MMREPSVKRRSTQPDRTEIWASFLQRRVMRLLLLHDPGLFHHQFRTFYVGSSLASHPLLQFYDRYIKLLMLSEELLNDILPRVQMQWSQHTERAIIQEENPLRGQIDWQRTIEQANHETPGQLPLRFATRLSQRHDALPENLFTVAVFQRCRQFVREALRFDQQEEILTDQEQHHLVSIEDHLERELAEPQLRMLAEEAQKHDLGTLVEQVKIHLHPGASPYRDLLDWWEHFSALQIGSATAVPHLSLAHSSRHNEHMNLWLYELWIVLELITLLQKQDALVPDTLTLVKDRLSFTFHWEGKRYHFSYQRRGMAGAVIAHQWEQVPSVYTSYRIERENPLRVAYKGKINWQEPPVVIDAAYAADTGEALQRLLGAMTVCAAEIGLLITPYLTDPLPGEQSSGEVRYDREHYGNHEQERGIGLYQLAPDLAEPLLQERLRAILQQIVVHLPERPQPICCGVMLDRDSTNASGRSLQNYDVLCPKPHIGPDVYNLVSRERHCLQDPSLCHVIGQIAMPPQVKRVVDLADLKLHIGQLREYGEAALKQAEEANDEEKAEQWRGLILQRVGETIEQYVKTHGDSALQIKYLRDGIFKEYWERHACCLEPETRHILVSGEYVWDECQGAKLDDWAAPAVQYCRAFERELKRRFYTPVKAGYACKDSQWTLGFIKKIYNNGHPGVVNRDWLTFTARAATFSVTRDILIRQFVHPMVIEKKISDVRNRLAHGGAIDRKTAEDLRDAILGIGQHGLLTWMVRNIGP
jgi:hypothetical protein